MKDKMGVFLKNIRIKNGAEAFGAALFSLAATALCLFVTGKFVYGRIPVYEELWAGLSLWDGYNKQGDMILFYMLYLLLPVFFVLFLMINHARTKSPTAYFFVLKGISKEQMEGIAIYIIGMILGLEAIRACQAAAIGQFPYKGQVISQLGLILRGVFLLAGICLLIVRLFAKKGVKEYANKLVGISALLLPLQFLGYFRFYYDYEGTDGLIRLFASSRYKFFCIGLAGILFLYQAYRIFKKKQGIGIVTLMLLGAGTVAGTPKGLLSVDFFHNGEMALPMQQLVSYGRLPYFDADPIHGLCDFFYSVINHLFFDGTYFSQNAAAAVGEILMAMFLAMVIGLCVSDTFWAVISVYLFMPFLVQEAGVRYLLFFAAFFVLFSPKVRKDSRLFLWWWVLLCMAGIAWNVSIGSSMAVAFLPEVLYRAVTELFPKLKGIHSWTKKEKRSYGMAYGLLLAAGLAYIPFFLQILRFLSENAGTTLYVNGSPIFGEEFAPVLTFAIVIPYLLALIFALWGISEGRSAFAALFFCLLVITNYACVRYDGGDRLAVLAVFFSLFLICVISGVKERMNGLFRGIAICLCLLLSLCLAKGSLPGIRENSMAAGEVPLMDEETAATSAAENYAVYPIVYVSGDSVDMPSLGTGFINANTLTSLQNVKTVLDAETEDEGYVDLTNRISHYVILDRRNSLPFTSVYNISNQKMQQKAIAWIKENHPRVILISPLIQFDMAPITLRSMDLYLCLIKMGYEPYQYEDVVYLVDGEAKLPEAVKAERMLGLIGHKEQLGALPLIWDQSTIIEEKGTEAIRELAYEKRQGNNGENVIIDFEQPLNGMEISYIRILPASSAALAQNLTLAFHSDVDGEVHRFTFLSRIHEQEWSGGYLIPVGSSAFWQYSEVEWIEIEGAAIEDVDRIEVYGQLP